MNIAVENKTNKNIAVEKKTNKNIDVEKKTNKSSRWLLHTSGYQLQIMHSLIH